jgi:hypothetical protein
VFSDEGGTFAAAATPRRLRVFDWCLRGRFWVVVFFRRAPGLPLLELCVYRATARKGWLHLWGWEEEPRREGGMAALAPGVRGGGVVTPGVAGRPAAPAGPCGAGPGNVVDPGGPGG